MPIWLWFVCWLKPKVRCSHKKIVLLLARAIEWCFLCYKPAGISLSLSLDRDWVGKVKPAHALFKLAVDGASKRSGLSSVGEVFRDWLLSGEEIQKLIDNEESNQEWMHRLQSSLWVSWFISLDLLCQMRHTFPFILYQDHYLLYNTTEKYNRRHNS